MVETLASRADDFAEELNSTLLRVLGAGMPEFEVNASPHQSNTVQRLALGLRDNASIPLSIDGEQALSLACAYHCIWDHAETYLKVWKASMSVATVWESTPLFRYEFVDGRGAPPSAHFHVHAHRDEFIYTMIRAQRGKPAGRAKRASLPGGSPPRLSAIHFPVGGPRMRPCLEDILQLLMTEFHIDVEPSAKEMLDAGRERWRRHQIGALVRDAPGEAAAALRSLGYDVADPPAGPAPDRSEALTRY